MKTFIESQFKYCPLVWMFHSRQMNNRLNRLHERALRVVYKDENISFDKLLEKDNSFSIHDRNLQKVALLMFKVKNKLCPIPVQNLFRFENGRFIIPRVRTEHKGKESLRYRGPVTLNLLPDDIKSSQRLQIFEDKIRSWKPQGW